MQTTKLDNTRGRVVQAGVAGIEPVRFAYALDRALELVTRPDARQIDPVYDPAGRLDTLRLLDDQGAPEVALDYGYDPDTGNLASLTRCDAPAGGGGCAGTLESLTFAYDGALPTTTTWSGTVAGVVTHGYDDDLRIASEQVSGEPAAIVFQYDDDNLLTGAGALSLLPHPQHGLLSSTALGVVTTSQSYSAFGELDLFSATGPSGALYSLDVVERDKLGRMTELVETLEGGPAKTIEYEYDTAGRLDLVRENGTPVRDYTHDANGNRLSTAVGNSTPIAAYDAQDRLTSYAGATYTYTANGELETKTEGGQTTSYAYDLLGNLTQVDLPGGTVIEYVIDGLGRRIGRKVNGTLERAWLYGNALEPVAELDGSGAVVSRFVYGSKANVPDYMVNGGVTYRILSDHLGSVRLVVNATSGTVSQRIDYDEFGNPTFVTGPADFQPFGFAGGLYDPDTGLVRFGARDYDAEVGRWTAKDPIRFEGDSPNLYVYALSDPVNLLDSTGLLFLVGGINVNAVLGIGGGGSVGVFAGTVPHSQRGQGLFGTNFNAGIFVSGEVAVGLDAGIGGFVGFQKTIEGNSINVNGSVFVAQGSVSLFTCPPPSHAPAGSFADFVNFLNGITVGANVGLPVSLTVGRSTTFNSTQAFRALRRAVSQ